jgi:hypothetical protein
MQILEAEDLSWGTIEVCQILHTALKTPYKCGSKLATIFHIRWNLPLMLRIRKFSLKEAVMILP